MRKRMLSGKGLPRSAGTGCIVVCLWRPFSAIREFPKLRVAYWGPDYKGIPLFGDLYWGSPIFVNSYVGELAEESSLHILKGKEPAT